MKLTDKQFCIAWGVLLIIMVGCCISEGWSEDTALLGGCLCAVAVIDLPMS